MTATAQSAWIPAGSSESEEGMTWEWAQSCGPPSLLPRAQGSRPPAPPPSDPGVQYLRVERVVIVCVIVVVTGVQGGQWQRSRMGESIRRLVPQWPPPLPGAPPPSSLPS